MAAIGLVLATLWCLALLGPSDDESARTDERGDSWDALLLVLCVLGAIASVRRRTSD